MESSRATRLFASPVYCLSSSARIEHAAAALGGEWEVGEDAEGGEAEGDAVADAQGGGGGLGLGARDDDVAALVREMENILEGK